MSEGKELNIPADTHSHNFAVIGVGGYIAPRHLNAIKANGHRVVAVLDRHDSVGILDSNFPDAEFFTEFERFDRHVEKLRRAGDRVFGEIYRPAHSRDSRHSFGRRVWH